MSNATNRDHGGEVLAFKTKDTQPQQCIGLVPGLGKNKSKVSYVDIWRKTLQGEGSDSVKPSEGDHAQPFQGMARAKCG